MGTIETTAKGVGAAVVTLVVVTVVLNEIATLPVGDGPYSLGGILGAAFVGLVVFVGVKIGPSIDDVLG